MKVIAKKYLNRFWFDMGHFTLLSFIVPAVFLIIYVKDSIWVHVVSYTVIILSIAVSIYIKRYYLIPVDIMTYENGVITYHQTRTKHIKINVSDIKSISSNQFRRQSSYHFGTLFIDTAEQRYTLKWLGNLNDVEKSLRELIANKP